jgi:hypothetical protein
MEINMEREILKGWRVKDFIRELEPTFKMVQAGMSWHHVIKTRKELKEWCMNMQPYTSEYIPEVVEYFAEKYKIKK